jgi:tetratricopeptide (TPR) repeat protein
VQADSLWNPGSAQPLWKQLDDLLDTTEMEVIELGSNSLNGSILVSDSDRIQKLNRKGEKLLAEGKTTEALSAFQEALELNPGCADAHNNMGVALLNLGQYESALDHLSKALDLNPDDRNIVLNCSDILNAFNKKDRAREILSDYSRNHPNDVEIATQLGDFTPEHEMHAMHNGPALPGSVNEPGKR